MNLIEQLKVELHNGFSKTQLEVLIGLPQNSLSGVISGTKKLSAKSEIKVKNFLASEKPNPLDFKINKKEINVQDLTEPTHQKKAITNPPKTTNISINTLPQEKHPGRKPGESLIDYRIRMEEKKA